MSRIDRIPPPPAQTSPALFRWFTDLRQALSLEAPITPTLSGGWQAYSSVYVAPQYWRRGDTVHLGGMVAFGNPNTAMFTLPPGYRPGAVVMFCQAAIGGTAQVRVDAGGNVNWLSGGSTWVSLDSINFRIR